MKRLSWQKKRDKREPFEEFYEGYTQQLLEDDEATPSEAAFMEGYEEDG